MLGVEIKFMVGGREVWPEKLGDALTAAVLEQVKKTVKDRLSRVRCPDHHQLPRVEVLGPSIGKLTWRVHGCCQRLVEEATKALK